VRDWRFNQRAEDIEWLLRLSAADGSASTVSWQILYNIASQQQWGELQRFLCPKLAQLRAFCQSQAIQKPGTGETAAVQQQCKQQCKQQRQPDQSRQPAQGVCAMPAKGSNVLRVCRLLDQQLHSHTIMLLSAYVLCPGHPAAA
jgi:hypothetical protein